MSENTILFDDWAVRRDGVFKARKTAYTASIIAIGVMFFVIAVAAFFVPLCAVMLIIPIIVVLCIYYEWLKVKNSHLIIKPEQIEITDRNNKTYIIKARVDSLTLELGKSYKKGGGIILRFYDAKGRLICEYEDMFNHAAPFQMPKTDWEIGIEELGVRIIDETEILKNRGVRK